jgi:hypothetical protein
MAIPPLAKKTSAFDAVRLALAFHRGQASVVRGMRLLQVPPQVHIQGYGHAHYDQRAYAQYQKPPDHPHSRLG